MNEEIANRAWEKAMQTQDHSIQDFVRGAVCYYRGFSQLAEESHKESSFYAIIARDIGKGLRSYISSDNLVELDEAMKKRMGKERRDRRPRRRTQKAIDRMFGEHWAQLSGTKWKLDKPLPSKPPVDVTFSDPETGMITTTVPAKDIKTNTHHWNHQFDEETIRRIRWIYDNLKGAHWDSYEGCVDGFQYDMNPYGEINIFERMAESSVLFFALLDIVPNNIDMEERIVLEAAVYNTLLMFTMGKVINFLGMPEELFASLGHLYLMDDIGVELKKSIGLHGLPN